MAKNRLKLKYEPNRDSLYMHVADRPSFDSDEIADVDATDFVASGGQMCYELVRSIHPTWLTNFPKST